LIALAIAALALPPMLAYAALRRQHSVVAVLLAMGWGVYLWWIARKLFSSRRPPE